MNSIFENIKSFTYIAEAVNPPQDELIMVKLNPAKININNFKNKMLNPAECNAESVVAHPDTTNKKHTYFVAVDDQSSLPDVENTIDELVQDGSIVKLTVDDAAQTVFDTAYSKIQGKTIADLEMFLSNPGNTDRQSIIAANSMMKSILRKESLMVKLIAKDTNAIRKRAAIDREKKWKEQILKQKDQVEILSDNSHVDITNILNNINYSDPSMALRQLAVADRIIKNLKQTGVLTQRYQLIFNNKFNEIKKKIGLPEEAFKEQFLLSANADLAYLITKFIHTQQKTEDEVAIQYDEIMKSLQLQKKTILPEDYDGMKNALYLSMEAKVLELRAISEHPELVVDAKTSGETGNIEIVSGEGDKMQNVYKMKIQLPLGRSVTIKDCKQYKGKVGAAGTAEEDILLKPIIAQSPVALHNLLGYAPTGTAAAVIAAYAPIRQFAGDIIHLAAKNTLGVLGALMGGVHGKELGEGVGRFLKHELIGNPAEINPAIADAEMWMRKRFNLFKVFKLEKSVYGTPEHVKKETDAFEKKINEQAVMPAAGGEAASAPTATPGSTMNTPGMITGAGDPEAPTRDKNGSGDVFNTKKKKHDDEKEEELYERVLDFDSFSRAMLNDK